MIHGNAHSARCAREIGPFDTAARGHVSRTIDGARAPQRPELSVPMRYFLVLIYLLLGCEVANGCSTDPNRHAPTVTEQLSKSEGAYLARLAKTTRTPLPGAAGHYADYYFVEKANFEVLVTFKGPLLNNKTLETVTTISPGNCRTSVREPFEVFGSDEKKVQNPFSDVWIIFLSGTKPYELVIQDLTRPINFVSESDLRELFRSTEHYRAPVKPPSKSLNRGSDLPP